MHNTLYPQNCNNIFDNRIYRNKNCHNFTNWSIYYNSSYNMPDKKKSIIILRKEYYLYVDYFVIMVIFTVKLKLISIEMLLFYSICMLKYMHTQIFLNFEKCEKNYRKMNHPMSLCISKPSLILRINTVDEEFHIPFQLSCLVKKQNMKTKNLFSNL